MDLDVALQRASEDEAENQCDEVYPGRVLKGEDTPGSAKIRYIRGCREPKTFARYTSSLKNMIPLRPFHKHEHSRASKVDESGLFSFITFSWIFPYLWAAFRGRLNHDQLWSCSIYDASSVNLARLEYLWKQELLQRPNRPSLFRVVCLFIKTRICVACFIFLFCLLFGFIGPMCFVKGLISFAEQPPLFNMYPNLGFGIFLAFAILIVETVRVLSYGATWAVSYRTGIRVRGALLALLYKKLINVRSLRTKTGAEVVNIFANDGQRLLDAVSFAPLVLVGPLVLIAGIIYLLIVIGPWSLLGILIFLVFDAIQFALGKTLVRFRTSAIQKTEKRINLLGEIIRCIRLIKMNAWEESFTNTIKEMRRSEKIDLRKTGLAQSLTIAFGSVVPVVAAVFTFLGLILSGGNLAAGDAFSTITVFFMMMFALRMVPYGSRYCAEAFASLKRIQELLLYPEYDQQIPFCQDAKIAVQFKNATFFWDNKSQASEIASSLEETNERSPVVANEQSSSDSAVALKNITLDVRRKELLGICGPVGSGKTALLTAIVGHLAPKDGSLNVSGQAAFITQTPWILNQTVQSNILFGLPMNTSRYYKAITVCELTKDLETMKTGDQTEIGERGVTISGGQKARISLARALFANCCVYLLDDIFASLDRQVADRIFKHAVKEMLANKTVLLVTTDIQRLSKCDRVCYMEGGKIKAIGTHDELLEKCESYALYCERSIYSDEIKSISETTEEQRAFGDDFVKIDAPDMADKFAKADAKVSDEFHAHTSMVNLTKPDGQLVMDEENFGSSAVSWAVYKQYIDAADGRWIWVVLLLAFIGNVVASIFSTAWLSQWLKYGHSQQIVNISGEIHVELSSIAESEYTSYYAAIYGFSVIILFVSGLLKALIFVHVSLNAASQLHNRMFDSVIRGTVRFFDTTPSGRILNRFSKDMDEIDVKLPFTAEVFLQNSLTCMGYLIMIAWVFPSFLLPCLFLLCIFTIFVLCFRAGITSLKRFENLSRSPLFDHISASMEGIQTIHSLGQTDDFIETLKNKLDLNSGAMFMYQSAMRWLAVWLDLLVVAITFIVALLIVLLTGSIAPTDAGMALVFALQMSGIFQFAVRTQTELEAKMTCVERVTYYSNHIDSEDDGKSGSSASNSCPVEGSIVFREVTMRYGPDLPLALDGVSFKIEPKEKIGIIGRTGSGKTSLYNVLYRLYPLTSGSIEIGGINTTCIELYRLRRAMAVIPQDPTLFVGTIRFNIDPNNEFTDDQIWMSLEKTYLKDMVSSLDQKLDSPVTEGGRNISVGERQLFCMARALLRRVGIVVLDEATGSLDNATDRHIQKCLREAFADCTVMIIAHRLENVLGLDKILHMKQGKVVEYDTIQNLVKNEYHPLRRLLDGLKLRQAITAQKEQSMNKMAADLEETSKASTNESSGSSPEHHPAFAEASGKTSPETSEFEKISDSIDKEVTTMSNDNSDLEVINKSDAESNY
uniref:ABC transporter n=1 Tax=Wuchereria bancrofti TaxID=6293 RepID=A0AAF5PL34_WUCBA